VIAITKTLNAAMAAYAQAVASANYNLQRMRAAAMKTMLLNHRPAGLGVPSARKRALRLDEGKFSMFDLIGLKRGLTALTVIGTLAAAGPANATIVVDGLYDSDYGSQTATVTFNAAAPSSNFGSPTSESAYIGYQIWLKAQGGNVYGFLQASGPGTSVGPFANVYWDLDPANGNGSDLGFELSDASHGGHTSVFIPGVAPTIPISNIVVAQSSDGLSIEFAIPNIDFTSPIAGLSYFAGHTLPSLGDSIVLRLSQSFGYSVAGGDSFGPSRLGEIQLAAAAPEVSTWIMMLLGFGFLGLLAYRRSKPAHCELAVA
jgi:hypothetical protein